MNNSKWIRSPQFDLVLVSGGAIFTLLVAFISFQAESFLPWFFWAWVIFFEGSHFWATFSRTYFDDKFRKENKSFLLGSLVFFLFPALALYMDTMSQVSYSTLYGLFIFIWSLYHNARQLYGFMSIYSHKAEISQEAKQALTLSLYMLIGFAQVHFLLNFKVPGTFGLIELGAGNATLTWMLTKLPLYLTAMALGFFFYHISKIKSENKDLTAIINYVLTCAVFYSTMFYFIAPRDLFIQGQDGAQKLMLIAIMNSLFHNIQYHAIVWHYGQSRFDGNKEYGVANILNSKTINYLMFSIAMGSVFGVIVWNLGDWPNLNGIYTNGFHSWAYIIFFGIIGHHFYLDQKIWRPSKQKDLRKYIN